MKVILETIMFETLSTKLTDVLHKLGNKGRLTEKEIDEALRDIRRALLEADVNYKVARTFVNSVKEKVMDDEILTSISAGQHIVKVTHDELIAILGGNDSSLEVNAKSPTVILMVGLNGSGKTTTSGKLAHRFVQKGESVSLIAADVHRPAAIEQLKIIGGQSGADVIEYGSEDSAVNVVKKGLETSKKSASKWTIVDTAGRFQIDEPLMLELEAVKKIVCPDEVLLVVDAMTGQEAVTVAQEFHGRIGVTGLVLTKMDGDARGGAALSITSVTGIPVKFIGVGEKIDGLEMFHPDRIASRILGMGDVVTLVEKAQATFDEDQVARLEKKIKSSQFDLDDFLDQMRSIKKMGPMNQILEMIPGLSGLKSNLGSKEVDESQFAKSEAIICSMTPGERRRPEQIGGSRRRRIAKGSGTSAQDVNQLLNQFKQINKMMKEMNSPQGNKRMMKMMGQNGGNPFQF